MLQTSETPRINIGDIGLVLICAWMITQAIMTGSVFWFVVGYMFFINYAVWRRESG